MAWCTTLRGMMVTMAAGLPAAFVTLSAQPANAEPPYRRPPDMYIVPPAPQGVGCYWYRGREFCGRYCYWEVNGKRYCREREREAHSQAPAGEVDVLPDAAPRAPMKLGAGGMAPEPAPSPATRHWRR